MESRENHLAGIARRLAGAGRRAAEDSEAEGRESADRAARRLASFPEYNPNPVIETDLDGNVTYVNPAARELADDDAGDPSRHPLADDLSPHLGRLTREGGGVVSREVRVGDAVFEQKILYMPEAIAIRIYSNDVTLLKASQEAMRAASESANALALQNQILGEVGRIISSSLDIDDVYARFGEHMRRLVAFDRLSVVLVNPDDNTATITYAVGEEAAGRRAGEVLDLAGTIINEAVLSHSAMVIQYDDMAELRRRYPNVLRYPSSVLAPLIYRGELFGILVARSSQPSMYADEDAEMLSRVASQITPAIANSLLYSAIAQAQEDLARSNSDLEQFAYAASHDLQEPLRTIGAYMTLVKDRYADVLDDTAAEFIGYAVDGAERMRVLIDDLLEYSRIDRGMPLEPVNCNDAVEDAVENLTQAIKDSRAKVDVSPLPTINGDRSQLSRLFQNLMGNALKFRQADKSPRVQVWAELREHEWVFAIKDNGIGISPEHQERVFEMFSRLHSRARYSGSGIGLALCSKIAQRHGGGIWVESEAGEGATFRSNIPVMS